MEKSRSVSWTDNWFFMETPPHGRAVYDMAVHTYCTFLSSKYFFQGTLANPLASILPPVVLGNFRGAVHGLSTFSLRGIFRLGGELIGEVYRVRKGKGFSAQKTVPRVSF